MDLLERGRRRRRLIRPRERTVALAFLVVVNLVGGSVIIGRRLGSERQKAVDLLRELVPAEALPPGASVIPQSEGPPDPATVRDPCRVSSILAAADSASTTWVASPPRHELTVAVNRFDSRQEAVTRLDAVRSSISRCGTVGTNTPGASFRYSEVADCDLGDTCLRLRYESVPGSSQRFAFTQSVFREDDVIAQVLVGSHSRAVLDRAKVVAERERLESSVAARLRGD